MSARAGYDAMMAGRALVVPGVANKIGAQSVRFVPRRVAAKIAGALNAERLMPRFKLVIEYAGTRYSGWQIQKNARTVQGEIDRAIREVAGRREFELYGSGRTDAGVHALAQVAHLELYTSLAPEPLRRRLNDELPADIHILTHRQGAAPLSRAARCRLAQLPLSDLAPAHGVRQALRLVDPRAARSRRHAAAPPRRSSAGRTSRPSQTTTPTRSPRSSCSSAWSSSRPARSSSSACRARIFSGRWCAESSACWPPSAAAR